MAKKKSAQKKKAKVKVKSSGRSSLQKRKSAAAGQLRLNESIWPIERDVLFRPDRLKYVRKLIPNDGCVFCRSAEEPVSLETLCLYKTQYTQVVVNKFPYNPGHILVLPLRHCGDLLQLSQEEYDDLQAVLRKAVEAIQSTYKPAGFNLGLNHGAVAGAGIPEHLHYHIVPRWAGDLNFFPLIAETKVVVESLEGTYNRLLAFFSK